MGKFTVGFGKADITPPLDIPYLGISPRHSFFKGVHDRLYARSVYISDGKTEVIIISTHSIGFVDSLFGEGKNFIQEVKTNIKEITGIDENNIMFASAHIHSTPDTLNIRPLIEHAGADDYLHSLIEKIKISACLSVENKFQGVLKVGSGCVPDISHNRRSESSCVDDELTLLFFESDSGDKIFLLNFACHPVIVQTQPMVSSDFVGVVEETVEKTIEGTKCCMFLQGACGDINPVNDDTHDFGDVYVTGISLAGEVLKVWGQMKLGNYPKQPAVVKSVSQQVKFPSRPLPSEKEIEVIKQAAEKGNFESEEMWWRIKEGNKDFIGEMQLIRIGNVLLTGIPGEPFCKLGVEIKKKSKPLIGIPVGYANGYLGYIAPPEEWDKGGYEVRCGLWSKIGKDAYGIVINSFEELKKEMIE